MSQAIWSAINPTVTSGTMLAALLTDFKDAIMSGCSGTSRPTNLQAGGAWIDTTYQAAPDYYWSFKLYTGSVDIEVFRINVNTGFGGAITTNSSFQRQQISANTSGAVFDFIKQRIEENGQIADGDTVGEIRWVGRTNTSTDPTVAYIKFVSSDDMTTSAYGGYLTFYATADGSSSLTEHMRFIAGLVEISAPHKLNALIMVKQNVSTTATIAALDATYGLVEMTGSTATDIQGINAAQNSQVVTIHNRSSAVVTLKHQSGSASAANRLKLPNSQDLTIAAEESATLYYCTTDTFWKIQESKIRKLTRYRDTVYGIGKTWTAPTGCTRVRVIAHNVYRTRLYQFGFLDPYGNAFAAGANLSAEIGDGTQVAKSSPVAVLGGFQFASVHGAVYDDTNDTMRARFGLTSDGTAYVWGGNGNTGSYVVGVGDGVPRSSPVAVLGGFKYSKIMTNGSAASGITPGGKLYSWGFHLRGVMGTGATFSTSSPIAVLGGLIFSRFDSQGKYAIGSASTIGTYAMGITADGVAYMWGCNAGRQLGVGDAVARSSPVAVLGGISWNKIAIAATGSDGGVSIGINTSGVAYSWGGGSPGTLGAGATNSASSPIAVLGGLTFVDVGTNATNSWGLTSSGALYMWGLNDSGQLGLGDVVNRSSPVAVLGGIAFERVFQGRGNNQGSMLGLSTDGILYGWGFNHKGQLGLGDIIPRSSPVAVLGSLKFADVLMSANYSTWAVASDGAVYGWGLNDNGQLALGDVTARSSPVAVLGSAGVDARNCNPLTMTKEINIPVTAGTSYTVMCTDTRSSFGNTPLGGPCEKITIEYEV